MSSLNWAFNCIKLHKQKKRLINGSGTKMVHKFVRIFDKENFIFVSIWNIEMLNICRPSKVRIGNIVLCFLHHCKGPLQRALDVLHVNVPKLKWQQLFDSHSPLLLIITTCHLKYFQVRLFVSIFLIWFWNAWSHLHMIQLFITF